MSRFLITGGAGFIGSHLADALLARGDSITVLDDLSTGHRANLPLGVTFIEGDVANAALVARAMRGMDGCFHLAAIASVQRGNEDWVETHRTNLTGTIAVFEAARRASTGGLPPPVIYASSAAVYGDNPNLPLQEDSRTEPLSAYGADKLSGELHARVAAVVHRVPTTGLRFFNVYGPRQNPKSLYSGVIAIFADHARAGIELRVNGDGGASRDFIYVADAVTHLVAAMDRRLAVLTPTADIFAVCTGQPTTILELATAIRRIAKSASPIVHGPERAGDIRHSVGDPSRAIHELGVRAGTTMEGGLRATLSSKA